MDLDYIKRTGIAAAYEGGKVLRSYFGQNPEIRKKGATDLVTQADTESEDAIIDTIRSRFPDHAFLGEESGLDIGSHENPSRNRWIIDPLDGTTNFAHELGFFCVSIAFERDDEVVIGVVLNPLNGELFSAVAGEGAFLNGRPISVSKTASVKESLLDMTMPVDRFPGQLKKSVWRYFSQ